MRKVMAANPLYAIQEILRVPQQLSNTV